MVNGSQSAHFSCRPLTSFTNVVYGSDVDASVNNDQRNEALGIEPGRKDDVDATTAVHKKRVPADQRRAAKKLNKLTGSVQFNPVTLSTNVTAPQRHLLSRTMRGTIFDNTSLTADAPTS